MEIKLELHTPNEKPQKAGYYLVWLLNGVVIECYARYGKFSPLAHYHNSIGTQIERKEYLYWAESPNVRKGR